MEAVSFGLYCERLRRKGFDASPIFWPEKKAGVIFPPRWPDFVLNIEKNIKQYYNTGMKRSIV